MKKYFIFALLLIPALSLFSQPTEWLTYYEKSNFLETPRYDESVEYSKQLASASEFIHYASIGVSPQGRDIPVLIIDKNNNFNPEAVKNSGNAILFIEACIHPGESEGKDAGFMLIRDIIIHEKYPELLENTTVLFIPILNVDGHERFSPYSRINQNGPKEMGWRTTAQNYNMNRDFVKADSPEMRYWLKFFNQWMPDMFIDIHTTDGADYEYSLTYAMHNMGDMSIEHTNWQNNYLTKVEKKLEKDDVLIFPYVSFRRWHDPRSGLVRRTASPRFSTGYLASQNRPALLVETHMLKDYKTRVDATYHLLRHTIEIIDKEHKDLQEINQKADIEAAKLAGKEFTLDYYTSQHDSTTVKFKGVDYDIVTSDLTNGDWIQFRDKPKEYELVLFEKLMKGETVDLPEAYIIPVEWSDVIDRLQLHGIEFKVLDKDKKMNVSSYKFSNVQFANFPFEGRQMVRDFNYETINIEKEFKKGSVIVPVNQRSAKLIAHLLEPAGPDSFIRWGFFNTIFERKEYVETYVMEKMAREMIKDNPELKIQFEKAVEENPELYSNQWAKLYWFFERTPYWDQQKDVYPVGRIFNLETLSN